MTTVKSEDGVRVNLRDLGGEGRALLMGHPLGFHGAVMSGVATQLSGVHCFAFDLRGHGATGLPNGYAVTASGFQQDALACAQWLLNGSRGGLLGVGHSGGGTALLLAELACPRTFERIFLYEPALLPRDVADAITADAPAVAQAARRRDWFLTLDDAYQNYASKEPMRSFEPSILRLYVDEGFEATSHGTVALRCRPQWEVDAYTCGMTATVFERLSEIECPVTVAAGTAGSAAGRAGYEREAAERLRRVTLLSIEGVDHFGPQAQPKLVAEAVQHWIDA